MAIGMFLRVCMDVCLIYQNAPARACQTCLFRRDKDAEYYTGKRHVRCRMLFCGDSPYKSNQPEL